jgi:hypothetical protein
MLVQVSTTTTNLHFQYHIFFLQITALAFLAGIASAGVVVGGIGDGVGVGLGGLGGGLGGVGVGLGGVGVVGGGHGVVDLHVSTFSTNLHLLIQVSDPGPLPIQIWSRGSQNWRQEATS